MKRLLLASAFAALPFAAQAADLYSDNTQYNFIQDNAPAQPAVVGHLSLGVSYVNENFGPDFSVSLSEFDYWLFDGAGRANVDFGWLNLELETFGQAASEDGASVSSIGGAVHLWGSMNNFAVGLYGGADFPRGFTIYTVGGEAEAYLGAITLGGDIDYNWWDCGLCVSGFWTARGWADFYVASNTRIGAEINYASFDEIDISAPAHTWGAVVDAEQRFAGTPVSIWIEGRYDHVDIPSGCGDCDIDTWSGMIGLRVFMDGAGTTLHEHDKLVPWEAEVLDWRSVPLFFNII